jgi:DNA-binding NarL/FixJ family response regulator
MSPWTNGEILPVIALPARGPDTNGSASPREFPSPQDPARSLRVLIVDDNSMFRGQLRAFMEDCEMEVVGEGVDGFEAVELATKLVPDVVLLDLRMPGLDGIGAARMIKDRCPHVRVIILSAYEDQALQEEARASRVDAYLIKGGSPGLLLDELLRTGRA